MKQVQLKIEEMFYNRIVLDQIIKTNIKSDDLNNLFKIIKTKLEWTDNETFFIGSLLPNESRETIIKALWEYQNSLLPKEYYLDKNVETALSKENDSEHYVDIGGFDLDDQINFYDPETRIITITKFNQDNKEE